MLKKNMIFGLCSGFKRAQGATNNPALNILILDHTHFSQPNVYISFMDITKVILLHEKTEMC